MPDNPCICFENIHEKHVHKYNRSKNYTFITVINKLLLRNLFYNVRGKKQGYNQNNNIYYKYYPSGKISYI